MIISSIVAIGNKNEIGVGLKLPWHMPSDLKYFKKTTSGHHVLMGRKSFDSVGRPLPKRTNIIVTRDREWYRSDVKVVHSIEAGIKMAKERGEEELFILGGGNIYKQTIPICDRLYITNIDAEIPEADIFFPEIDYSKWNLASEECFKADEKNIYDFCFRLYER